MNFNTLSNTWCKFKLNTYDANQRDTQPCRRTCPSAFTLGMHVAQQIARRVSSDLRPSVKAL